ncbi:MAG: DUF421 domain-containing protein [Planctomycetia bacterium]|nr:DUF421 domain-containing protein [Planctomycetia bacterium]
MLTKIFEVVFGGNEPHGSLEIYQVAARAIVVYISGILIVRIGKSRVIGRVTSLDIILGFILGSLLSRGITGHAPISDTLIASAALVATHWLLTIIACRSHRAGVVLKGSPILLIEHGKVLLAAMREAHISGHDLEEGLRLNGIENFAEVKYAYKERNGEISVIKTKPDGEE